MIGRLLKRLLLRVYPAGLDITPEMWAENDVAVLEGIARLERQG